jgi:hypothetical protein
MSILCYHGCGQPATHATKTSRATKGPINQCAKSANACPAVKDRKKAKVSAHTEEQRAAAQKKREATNLAKYGTTVSIMSPDIQAKRRQTLIERYGVEQPTLNEDLRKKAAAKIKKAYQDDPTYADRIIETRKKKHGEQYADIVNKIRDTNIENGRWVDPALRTPWAQYKFRVKYLTSKLYKKHKALINPDDLPIGRCDYQIDHIYSVRHGFENGVDPDIIASLPNLRLMWHTENKSKHIRSDQTLEALLEAVKKGSTAENGTPPPTDRERSVVSGS